MIQKKGGIKKFLSIGFGNLEVIWVILESAGADGASGEGTGTAGRKVKRVFIVTGQLNREGTTSWSSWERSHQSSVVSLGDELLVTVSLRREKDVG